MIKSLENIQKILVINLAFIGDVLLSTPVTRALREAYPQAMIDMLVMPVTAEIAGAIPYVDHVFVYDKRGKHKKLKPLFELIREVRSQHYDLAVCTNFALRGAAVAWAARIPCRAGYDAQHAAWFLTHAASSTRTQVKHEAENYLDVLKPLGITTKDTQLALEIPEKYQNYAKRVLKESGAKPLVLLCPYGSYARKSWPDQAYIELIRLIKDDCSCYLIGGKAEGPRLENLRQASGLAVNKVLAGSANLVELASLIKDAKALVTVDTGPLHIAQAVKTPVLALFGPTAPRVWGPRGPKDVIFYHGAACSPCWGKGTCKEKVCMLATDVSQVSETLFHLIE